ncbi:MAG TPA: hypothetical protein VMW05_04495 [Methyloceanibacter sp.]|nr:hypothetical protein [Methyloceanibacter sp.]
MPKLLKVVTVASMAALVGGVAVTTADFGADTQSQAKQDRSVILALAPPHRTLTTDPAVDLAPSLPKTPPLPQSAPIPTIDMASEKNAASEMDKAVMAKTAMSAPERPSQRRRYTAFPQVARYAWWP